MWTRFGSTTTARSQLRSGLDRDVADDSRHQRTILLMSPSVHPSGPSGAYSISGSMWSETLYMVNGVNVSENLRGQALNLIIEDAVQETTVATAGVSAEFGRFGGGVINVVTKSGGNTFTGTFRDTLNNDNWRSVHAAARGQP